MKPYQLVVTYAKHVGVLQGLLHALLLGACWYFFTLVVRTESAVPSTTSDHRVTYLLTEHGTTFEWPLAGKKHTLKYHLIQGGLVVSAILLVGLIIYNFSKIKIDDDVPLRLSGFEREKKAKPAKETSTP
ncbi:MAG TPA: hypothetical protein VL981_00920 [Candidatus Methylacidiphilales bacterium]|nr:hypothetical protein [Candidatus Methylacidiphilales bacterium]